MSKIISNHNKKILNKEKNSHNNTKKKCDCKNLNRNLCPLEGNCINETVVYKATVSIGTEERTYIGSTEGVFKKRFNNHKSDFKYERNKSKTTLATYIWDCKAKDITPSVKWDIVQKCSKYKGGNRKCDLCLTEKLLILRNKHNPLNKRTELMAKCRHLRKFKLQAVKDPT